MNNITITITALFAFLSISYANTESTGGFIYEDAEDGGTDGWRVYDNNPIGATITNVIDEDRGGHAIQLQGESSHNGFILGNSENRPGAWNDTQNTQIRWSIKSLEDFTVFVRLMTVKGGRYLSYQPTVESRGLHANGKYIHHTLGLDAKDGTWKTFTRDLVEDLKQYEPDNELLSVNAFLVRGNILVDDIELGSEFNVADTTPPILTLIGESLVTLMQGELYVEFGANALDNTDGSVGVTISGNINSAVSGVSLLTYTAIDAAGNQSSAIRIVKVVTANGGLVYEDAEDGRTDGWRIYDNTPAGATIMNVVDKDRSSNVIQLQGTGSQNGFILGNSENRTGAWNDDINTKISWSMKSSEAFTIFTRLMTTKGWRYLSYQAVATDRGLHENGKYIHHALGVEAKDGTWRTFRRDLAYDLNQYEPDNKLLEVNAFLVRGNVLIDDVELSTTFDAQKSFVAFQGTPSYSLNGNLSVYRSNINGHLIVKNWETGERFTIQSDRSVYSPVISNDDRHVFYLQLSKAGYYSELYRYSIEDRTSTKMTSGEQGDVYNFAVSSNGKICAIAFKDGDKSQHLYLIDISTGLIEKLETDQYFEPINIDMDIRPVFSNDGNYIFLAVKKTLYAIDVFTQSVHAAIDLPTPAHHISGSGHFTALSDNLYQIFQFYPGAGNIVQITTGPNNKISPSANTDGDLYYIDVGADTDFASLMDFTWFSIRNSSSNYKDYLNNWGRISWQESKMLRFLRRAFKVTQDSIYMNSFIDHATSVLDNMDKNRRITDFSGTSSYGWSSTRYSIDRETPMKFVVHSAMIGIEMLEFSHALNQLSASNIQSEILMERMDIVLAGIIAESTGEWREGPTDALMIAQDGEGYFVSPYGSPFPYDGINLPFNMQNRYGHMLTLMHERVGDERYLEMATGIANVFKRHLRIEGDSYIWNYWWGKGADGWNNSEGLSINTPSYDGHKGREGKGYATVDLEFAIKMANFGLFEPQEIERFKSSLLNGPLRFNEIEAASALQYYAKDEMETYVSSRTNYLSMLPHELTIRASYDNQAGWGKATLVQHSIGEGNSETKVVPDSEGVIDYQLSLQSIAIMRRKKDSLPTIAIIDMPE